MFVTVASFLDPLEARIVHGRLTAEGIEAYLADEHQAINDWYMRQALGGVKLRVRNDQAGDARALIAQLAEGALALEADDSEPATAAPDSLSQRAAFLGLFALGLPLPWRRRRPNTP
jgi:MYXO-CTERM domain-containing protein